MPLVNKLKLCRTHTLSIEPGLPYGVYERWGHLQPLRDPRPAWARPHVLFLFNASLTSWEVRDDALRRLEHQFVLQHLTVIYVVVMKHPDVWLVRYDRSGCIESSRQDFVQDPSVLPDLFWRLEVLTDEQLGMDPTAIPILPGSPEDVFMDDLARKRVDTDIPWHEGAVVPEIDDSADRASARQWGFARSWFGDSIYPAQDQMAPPDFAHDQPRWKLLVPTGGDAPPREFLVGVPIAFRSSVKRNAKADQRNTRVYVAYDCTTGKLVCLKDTWRAVKEDAYRGEREGKTLEKLNRAGVPFVPTLVCEADLPGQETWAQTDLDDPDADDMSDFPPKRKHHRLVTEELCMHLNDIKTSRALVSVVGDCIVGEHRMPHNPCKSLPDIVSSSTCCSGGPSGPAALRRQLRQYHDLPDRGVYGGLR